MLRTVNILGEECEVSITQQSKTVWRAVGKIEGETLTAKDRTANTAIKMWAEAAKYKRARN